jgi:hypothetical protein
MTARIIHTYEFWARSASGKTRVIICSEDRIERGGPGETQKYSVPTGLKSYKFKGGEPAAKIGDAFLDSSGEIYRRIT